MQAGEVAGAQADAGVLEIETPERHPPVREPGGRVGIAGAGDAGGGAGRCERGGVAGGQTWLFAG